METFEQRASKLVMDWSNAKRPLVDLLKTAFEEVAAESKTELLAAARELRGEVEYDSAYLPDKDFQERVLPLLNRVNPLLES